MRILRNKLAPLSSLIALVVGSAQAQDYGSYQKAPTIEWRTSYRQAADEAARDGKPLVVRVTATWCGPCRQMKQLTFTDSRVVDLIISSYVPLIIDADENQDLVQSFRVEAYPTTFVLGPDLTILKKMSGYQSASDMAATLKSLAKSPPAERPAADSENAVSALEPTNGIKLAFDGYCLVSILEETRVRRGSSEFTAEHRGQTLCFVNEEGRQKFIANPDKYWPVANGQCLVKSREEGSVGLGDPRMAVTWRGRIWMFSDRQRQRRFIQTPHYYVANEL